MKDMGLEHIEKVRQYTLWKFYELLDGEFELPKYQSMDNIETKYISQDIATRDFIDRGIFGLLDMGENDFLASLEKIERFCQKLQHSKTKFSETHQIKELKKIIRIMEEEITKRKNN